MQDIELESGHFRAVGRLLPDMAPQTCGWFLAKLPFEVRVVQAVWSGMAVFADLAGAAHDVPFENITSYPATGSILLYPGNAQGNAGEIYIPYGGNKFCCPIGQIAGNHFMTLTASMETLRDFGRLVRYGGEQTLHFKLAAQEGTGR